jgi:hypothetical protein
MNAKLQTPKTLKAGSGIATLKLIPRKATRCMMNLNPTVSMGL